MRKQSNRRGYGQSVEAAPVTPQTERPAFIALTRERFLSPEYKVGTEAARALFAVLGAEHVKQAKAALVKAGVTTHISTNPASRTVVTQPILEGA